MSPFARAQIDYYTVLEIPPSAEPAEVSAAFRRLAWRYHPDRNPAPGATLQFQDINEAHQVLSDPERRAEYDAQWHPELRARPTPPRAPVRPHSHRGSRSRHRMRAVLVALFAFVFVSGTWALIFTVMTTTRYAIADNSPGAQSSFNADASQTCAISMEMYPVTYIDEHGRQSTAWETDVRNCWGGSTRLSSMPELGQSLSRRSVAGPADR
jgi:curved DNA-binding protein CbpA